MFPRMRNALGLALLAALFIYNLVSAKGGFPFITIQGPDRKEPVRVTNPDLTGDYFAFADFYRERTEAPANAGTGYEITRYYIDGNREAAFDHLHYYPDGGYVYYDGMVNGSSEYDGKWYTAKPEMKEIFKSILSGMQSELPRSVEPVELVQQPSSFVDVHGSIAAVVAIVGLALLLVFALSRRNVFA